VIFGLSVPSILTLRPTTRQKAKGKTRTPSATKSARRARADTSTKRQRVSSPATSRNWIWAHCCRCSSLPFTFLLFPWRSLPPPASVASIGFARAPTPACRASNFAFYLLPWRNRLASLEHRWPVTNFAFYLLPWRNRLASLEHRWPVTNFAFYLLPFALAQPCLGVIARPPPFNLLR
jgi:hypothetical protein